MELAHYFIKGERTDLRGGIRPPFLIGTMTRATSLQEQLGLMQY